MVRRPRVVAIVLLPPARRLDMLLRQVEVGQAVVARFRRWQTPQHLEDGRQAGRCGQQQRLFLGGIKAVLGPLASGTGVVEGLAWALRVGMMGSFLSSEQ